MNWNRNLHEQAGEAFSNWAHPPNGGRWKMVGLGLALPLWVAYRAWLAWTTEKAIWFGEGNSDMEVQGETAKALAICYLAGAMFAHFRWFWGLWPIYRVFEVGLILSILIGLSGCGAAYYFAFR